MIGQTNSAGDLVVFIAHVQRRGSGTILLLKQVQYQEQPLEYGVLTPTTHLGCTLLVDEIVLIVMKCLALFKKVVTGTTSVLCV